MSEEMFWAVLTEFRGISYHTVTEMLIRYNYIVFSDTEMSKDDYKITRTNIFKVAVPFSVYDKECSNQYSVGDYWTTEAHHWLYDELDD